MEVGIKTISAHRDFELNSFKNRRLSYYFSIPEKSEGLVVFIPGFGDDNMDEYQAKFVKYISENFNLSCISTNYLCKDARLGKRAYLKIPTYMEKFIRVFLDDFSSPLIELINKMAELRKNKNNPLVLPAFIVHETDYQNFGLLPALDVIYSIIDFFKNNPTVPKKVILIGSSYGGYIANLVTKFIPGSISAVFDNSSWAKINKSYINGIEFGSMEHRAILNENICMECSVLTPWTVVFPQLPTYLDEDRVLIREFPKEHLQIMKENGADKIKYRFIHSQYDKIAPLEDKLDLVKSMKSQGFDVEINIYDERDIDGKFIKNMHHGMGISIREFFKRYYDALRYELEEIEKLDFEEEKVISFRCKKLSYNIRFEGDYRFPVMYIESGYE